jgi:solute:Na+ symporter, SSS family
VFQRHRVTSIYEFIAVRFGQPSRTTCAIYFLFSRVLASTVRIVAIAKVLEVVTGGRLSFELCVILVVGVILGYTTIGGGRAIAWTDLMQFILLMTGAIVSMVYLVSHVPGGISKIIDIGQNAVDADGKVYNKFNFLELFKPENLEMFFLISIWGFFQSSAAYGTDQDMTQRLLACNNPQKARWSLVLSGLISIFVTFLFLSIGVCLYAYAQFHPELVQGMTDTDHVFPRFIISSMPDGLKGLLLAAVASAAMGSTDSALASLSTSFVIDFYKPYWGKNASEQTCVRVSKISFVIFGILMVIFSLLFHDFDKLLWLGFKIVGFTYGPLLGIFCVAILTNWRVSSSRIIPLMIATTAVTATLGIAAYLITKEAGASDFWTGLQNKWWRLYVIGGALAVIGGSYLLKDKEPYIPSSEK